MTFQGLADLRPPRVSFTNLRTGETVEAPLFPESLEEEVVVNWARQGIVGMSHSLLQYGYTDSYKLPGLELPFRGTSREEVDRIHDVRLFLLSACYPPEGASTVREGAPPRLLFFWPQLVSLTCVITNLKIRHQRMNSQGRPTFFVATLDLEEIRDFRLTMDNVRVVGSRRAVVPPESL